MSLRYYVLGSVALFSILYFSREMRDVQLSDLLKSPLTSWLAEPSPSPSVPRHVEYSPRQDVEETKEAVKEKTALEQWIQARLTQKGLKEMTESGHWQAEQSVAL